MLGGNGRHHRLQYSDDADQHVGPDDDDFTVVGTGRPDGAHQRLADRNMPGRVSAARVRSALLPTCSLSRMRSTYVFTVDLRMPSRVAICSWVNPRAM